MAIKDWFSQDKSSWNSLSQGRSSKVWSSQEMSRWNRSSQVRTGQVWSRHVKTIWIKLTLCHPGFWILVVNRGGSSGPTAIFWHLGAFLCPLVTMLNPIQNKGGITDHIEKKIQKKFETPLIYSVFRSQGEKGKFLEMFFFNFKPLYLSQILTD